jgi:hypothetical protein
VSILAIFVSGLFSIQMKRITSAFVATGIAIGCLILLNCSIQRDAEEARAVARRVHRQMLTGDFATIYNDAAPAFKAEGSGPDFVAGLSEFQQQLGLLKSQQEVSYQTVIDSKIGRTHLLTFDLEFDQGRARERLMLARSNTGKMELWRLDIQPVD